MDVQDLSPGEGFDLVSPQSLHGKRSPICGHELDFICLATVVYEDDRAHVAGLQSEVRQILLQGGRGSPTSAIRIATVQIGPRRASARAMNYFLGIPVPTEYSRRIGAFRREIAGWALRPQRSEPHISVKGSAGLDESSETRATVEEIAGRTAPFDVRLGEPAIFEGEPVLFLSVESPGWSALNRLLVDTIAARTLAPFPAFTADTIRMYRQEVDQGQWMPWRDFPLSGGFP